MDVRTGDPGGVGEYRRYRWRKTVFVLSCLLLTFLFVGLYISVGATKIPFLTVYGFLVDHILGVTYPIGTDEFLTDFVIWEVRLPRVIFALIGGAGLAVGGAIMQNVMNNPLADPYSTGISSGACFGVAVAMILGISVSLGSQTENLGVMLNAFIFALIPMMIIVTMAPKMNSSPATLILAGTAVAYIFNALTTVLMMSTDAETLAVVYQWQVGSLSEITWQSLPLMAAVNMVGIVLAMLLSSRLNVLALGDDSAKSLGLNASNMRIVCLMVISFMVAAVVCYAGIISFIGLISAHIVRTILGSDNKFVIPASAAFGGLFLVLADLIARYLSPQDAIPVGVVLSFIGAPVFLALIVREKRGVW
ncbi:MAG: iron ABC transporter permease [Candidatus Methanomethylophilaceae archaeon]|nr:iron ABC transporter permease [Candidatus Methanomethylophilaceae archaeon]